MAFDIVIYTQSEKEVKGNCVSGKMLKLEKQGSYNSWKRRSDYPPEAFLNVM